MLFLKFKSYLQLVKQNKIKWNSIQNEQKRYEESPKECCLNMVTLSPVLYPTLSNDKPRSMCEANKRIVKF